MSMKAKERREDELMKEDDRKLLSSQTNSSDPKSLNARVFIGNLPSDKVTRQEIEEKFSKFGKVAGISLHRGFAFVQYDHADDAEAAAKQENGTLFKGFKVEVNVASLRRKEKDDRMSRPAARRRTPPPYDDRRRREYRDRSPHKDGNLLDDRARRDLPRFSRDERLRDERLPYYDVGNRRSFDEVVSDRRFAPRDDVKFRRDSGPDNYREQFNEPSDSRYPNDCEIIVANRQSRLYAEMIEARLKNLNLRTDLLFPRENSSIPHILDDIAKRGCLYTVVILQQNEQHKSVTVNILWGKPQEHRNMPLDDALSLIARNFDSYLQSVRERIPTAAAAIRDRPISEIALASSYPPVTVESGVQVLLNLLADGRPLSVPEIDRVIRHLQDRKERLLKEAEATVTPSPALYNKPDAPLIAAPPPVKTVQDQQAELQKRILSILNNPTPSGNQAIASVLGNTNIGAIASNWNEPHANNSNPSSPMNLDNPNVQKALDNLIQSGPALLRTLKGVNPPNIAATQAQLIGQMNNNSNPVIAQAQRAHQSPPIQPQQQIVAPINNFSIRNPLNPQQQRHPLLGTLTPISPGLMSRGAVGARRF